MSASYYTESDLRAMNKVLKHVRKTFPEPEEDGRQWESHDDQTGETGAIAALEVRVAGEYIGKIEWATPDGVHYEGFWVITDIAKRGPNA